MEELRKDFTQFVKERDWDQYHNPKNLAICLACEAAELLEIFQWLTPEESSNIMQNKDAARQVREEIGDVFNNIIYLSSLLGIDPLAAGKDKLELNKKKYPVASAKGSNKKHE